MEDKYSIISFTLVPTRNGLRELVTLPLKSLYFTLYGRLDGVLSSFVSTSMESFRVIAPSKEVYTTQRVYFKNFGWE